MTHRLTNGKGGLLRGVEGLRESVGMSYRIEVVKIKTCLRFDSSKDCFKF